MNQRKSRAEYRREIRRHGFNPSIVKLTDELHFVFSNHSMHLTTSALAAALWALMAGAKRPAIIEALMVCEGGRKVLHRFAAQRPPPLVPDPVRASAEQDSHPITADGSGGPDWPPGHFGAVSRRSPEPEPAAQPHVPNLVSGQAISNIRDALEQGSARAHPTDVVEVRRIDLCKLLDELDRIEQLRSRLRQLSAVSGHSAG